MGQNQRPPPAPDDADDGPENERHPDRLRTKFNGGGAQSQDAATALPRERLACLARKIHGLGERPLYELFCELDAGANLHERLERYAALEPLGGFIAVLDGARLPPARLVKGRP